MVTNRISCWGKLLQFFLWTARESTQKTQFKVCLLVCLSDQFETSVFGTAIGKLHDLKESNHWFIISWSLYPLPGLISQKTTEMIISCFWDEEKFWGNAQQVKIKSINSEQKESLIIEEILFSMYPWHNVSRAPM